MCTDILREGLHEFLIYTVFQIFSRVDTHVRGVTHLAGDTRGPTRVIGIDVQLLLCSGNISPPFVRNAIVYRSITRVEQPIATSTSARILFVCVYFPVMPQLNAVAQLSAAPRQGLWGRLAARRLIGACTPSGFVFAGLPGCLNCFFIPIPDVFIRLQNFK